MYMRSKIFCLILLSIFVSSPLSSVEAGGVLIRDGFFTGNSFREMSQAQQLAYVTGLFDGMMLAPMLGAPESEMKRFDQMKGINNGQILAIVTKALEEHPEEWHECMHTFSYLALGRAFHFFK